MILLGRNHLHAARLWNSIYAPAWLIRNMGILQAFKSKVIATKESIEKIRRGTEDFKTKHKRTNKAVSTLIRGLPPPFNTFGEIVWDGLEKQDDSGQKMLEILEKISNNDEANFRKIATSIDKLFEYNASKGDLQQLGKEMLTSNRTLLDILNPKVDKLITLSNEIKDEIKKDPEAVKVHFEDLKKYVIRPLLSEVRYDKDLFDAEDENAKREFRTKSAGTLFNLSLFEDLLQNHYPSIGRKWREIFEKYQSERCGYEKQIITVIKSELDRKKLGYLDEMPPPEEIDDRGLGLVIISNFRKYLPDGILKLDLKEELIHDLFGRPRRMRRSIKGEGGYFGIPIYFDKRTRKKYSIRQVLKHLQEIQKNETIAEACENLKNIESHKGDGLENLRNELSEILLYTALKIVRKSEQIQCRFINPDL